MVSKTGAIGNEYLAREATEAFLASGHSAVDAVLAGFFVSAGHDPHVLLSPVSMLIAGVGVGARAFDGRTRQPGLAAKRPRGIKAGERVPVAARAALSASVQALMVAHAYAPSAGLSAVLRPSVRAAESSDASGRAALLRRITAVGAQALAEAGVIQAVLRIVGPAEGGQIGPADFTASGLDVAVRPEPWDGTARLEPPWARPSQGADDPVPAKPAWGEGFVLGAIDARGTFAVVAYRKPEGLMIDQLELALPLLAEPVRRGIPRTRPGTALFTPAPIAIIADALGTPVELRASPGATTLAPDTHGFRLFRDPARGQVLSR